MTPGTLAVVSNDAGGAEILSSYVSQQGLECHYVLQGPALRVFERKAGIVRISMLEEAIRQSEWVLCGTSWQSDLEFNAIKLARSLGKRSVAFLDHWVNYRERFVRGGEIHLPDEIWVGDPIAKAMAVASFANLPIRLVENPYYADIRRELAAAPTAHLPRPDRLSVLYVCEPVREPGLLLFGNERHFGYVEEEALRYFLQNVTFLGNPVNRIVIRPHPSEPVAKYEWALTGFDLPIAMGGSRPLVEEIAQCDVVVGCESMAMVVGLIAGKRVISCIPPGGKPCSLPQPEIKQLQALLRNS